MLNGNRLHVLRAEKRVTQWDLALEIGFSRDRYWRIEKGYASPTDAEIAKLAKFFDVPASDLGFGVPVARTA